MQQGETRAPASSDAEYLAPGTVVASRYTVASVVGEGATGIVYVATDGETGARVALKVIHRSLCFDPHFSRRFTREASILKQLEGNHIVRLLDVTEDDGLPVLVLEYVEGLSLEATLRKHRPTIEEAVEITLQICAALGAAHAGGFVHRDLKPGNVIIQGELGTGRQPTHGGSAPTSGAAPPNPPPMVWVVDFGLGKALHRDPSGTSLTERNMILGTPEYMSPEQVRGDELDHRCDIYAAGVLLFEMLTGRAPFAGKTPIAAMTAHLTEPVPSPRASSPDRDIPPTLEAVVHRALAKNPDERYETARAFAEALSAARDEHHVIAPAAVDDADALATGDTELELRTAVAKAVALEQKASTTKAAAERPGQPVRWPWILVAVVLAAVAIAVGAMAGAR
ncbi:serine/threonine-protein kinase [Polyangium jinanense]|uniref:non-specific serine/threonine protein kinase n=1 Tax=Polyangium jinanense TaxID=2829994 RepID=A0A9X3X025_9BACT|nr:serine/threonine-protein kinase [Polyangium jinanense]MDC3953136.1 serine/threonine protein kinase [Polyangium jinanense]MDC3979743.1 serine/threonine protein kinase [Polyangium jinanense]